MSPSENDFPRDEPDGWSQADRHWMGEALEQARRARDQGEVPIGAVIAGPDAKESELDPLDLGALDLGALLGRGFNRTRQRADPTAHAEILAVRQATRLAGYQRLDGATVYSTVEPCFMCAGALIHARVKRVVWALRDPKFGGCVSLGKVLSLPGANHQAQCAEGLMAPESRELMQAFFRTLRRKN